jgi:hypothetical protein
MYVHRCKIEIRHRKENYKTERQESFWLRIVTNRRF